MGLSIHVWNKTKVSYKIMRQKGSFWNWYKMMGIIKAIKCCQKWLCIPMPWGYIHVWNCEKVRNSLLAKDQLLGERYTLVGPLVAMKERDWWLCTCWIQIWNNIFFFNILTFFMRYFYKDRIILMPEFAKMSLKIQIHTLYEPCHEKTCCCHMRTAPAQSDQRLCCSLPR